MNTKNMNIEHSESLNKHDQANMPLHKFIMYLA